MIISGEFQGAMTYHADGLAYCVRQGFGAEVATGGNGAAFELVGPAGGGAQVGNRVGRSIRRGSMGDARWRWHPDSQLFAVALDQVGQFDSSRPRWGR